MQKKIYYKTKNISWHLIWIMALLELLTVPQLVLFYHSEDILGYFKTPWHGFIIGAIGTFLIFKSIFKKIKI